MLIRFGVRGNLRFLSHAETVRVFQRACVRAGIKIQYSQGFNPHPKLSLPLPRSVGVESDDDLLCLRVDKSTRAQEDKCAGELCSSIKTRISQQLPDGFELLSVSATETNISPQPSMATYVLVVREEYPDEKMKARIEHLLASDTLNMQRSIIAGKSKIKNVDVRGFLKSIVLKDKCIVVECKISSAGSIRVEEILNLLELGVEKLAAPIRRTSVQWQN
ncbi:MAG: TIGR03936 family radical SAM-associated protein [Planctomycetota bacterium]|nr:TIGR03936 family radical SAM-associated protein [Planctomycetota bacterium]